MWIATEGNGLARYDPAQDRLTWFRKDPKDPNTIASDRLNKLSGHFPEHLLIASENVPIMFLHKKDLSFSYWKGDGPVDPAHASARFEGALGWCHDVIDLDGEKLWVGLLHNAVNFFVDKSNGAIIGTAFDPHPDIPTRTSAIATEHGIFACGWFKGIHKMDTKADRN